MKLHNEFAIDVAPDRAWDALNDPRLVAPCFPGADLTAFEGDSFSGTVKVRLGPISREPAAAGWRWTPTCPSPADPRSSAGGVISDVADTMIGRFASCVAVSLADDDTPDRPPADTREQGSPGDGVASSGRSSVVPSTTASGAPTLSATALLGSVAPALARRAAPGALAVLGAVVVLGLLRRGRRAAPSR